MQMTKQKKHKMKNNTVLYLMKGENNKSALLKRRALDDYFSGGELVVTEKGKPVISGRSDFGISISHSGGVLAAVISNCNVGLDVQERMPRDKERLKSFFHESERELDFYDTWVRKEAYGKMTGDGIFSQKGKKLPEGVIFWDISKEVSGFAGKDLSAVICFSKKDIGLKKLEVILI